MRIPDEGVRRYAVSAVGMTLLWGVTFGLLDNELDEAGNWLYALGTGLVFAGIIAVADHFKLGRRKMGAPPSDVMTAVLRGGPYDRLAVEIEEGQTEITLGPENLIKGGVDLPVARYEYSGRQDGNGDAIFEVAD